MARYQRSVAVAAGLAAGLVLATFSSSASATFPGANGRIAYELSTTIHTILPNGTEDMTLAAGELPSWSPNGKRIAFARGVGHPPNNNSELFTMRADGSDLRRLTHDSLIEGVSSYSPSGHRIAFVGEGANGAPVIFSVRSDGSGLKRLRIGQAPSYSPTGKRIAFERDPNLTDKPGIYSMRPDGSDLRRLTAAPRVSSGSTADDAPDYSPDGRLIVFTRTYENGAAAFTVPASGGRVSRLGACAAINPAFSPDGRYLVSDTYRRGTPLAIGITPTDGACPAKQVVGGDVRAPSWQSLP